jgi:hypothetical protein
VRDDLLQFLKRDSEARGATIICTYSLQASIFSTYSVCRRDPHLRRLEPLPDAHCPYVIWALGHSAQPVADS